ncbi:hypothetical protein A9Q91_02905 [Candidatus Gracilibacteria bacterium 28_42_T64]|nr:hypothetical protein A9Q91_02905 [Candidatus Gracilibacteria bacterium 28_42_T64]
MMNEEMVTIETEISEYHTSERIESMNDMISSCIGYDLFVSLLNTINRSADTKLKKDIGNCIKIFQKLIKKQGISKNEGIIFENIILTTRFLEMYNKELKKIIIKNDGFKVTGTYKDIYIELIQIFYASILRCRIEKILDVSDSDIDTMVGDFNDRILKIDDSFYMVVKKIGEYKILEGCDPSKNEGRKLLYNNQFITGFGNEELIHVGQKYFLVENLACSKSTGRLDIFDLNDKSILQLRAGTNCEHINCEFFEVNSIVYIVTSNDNKTNCGLYNYNENQYVLNHVYSLEVVNNNTGIVAKYFTSLVLDDLDRQGPGYFEDLKESYSLSKNSKS